VNDERLMSILIAPHVSEKSTRVADGSNQFTFRVRVDARKPEVRRAVEKMFNVEVESVSVLNVKGKSKGIRGRIRGRRPDRRKAYVRLKPGHDIDFLGPVE
jgi:large subunit ribosomal protein L23